MNPNPRPLREGDVFPSHVLRDQYGMKAENRPYFTIEKNEVPDHLHYVIPFAERWAISCDVTRGDYFAKQPEDEIADFYYKVLPFIEQKKVSGTLFGQQFEEALRACARWRRIRLKNTVKGS